jgi:hypothetical protein
MTARSEQHLLAFPLVHLRERPKSAQSGLALMLPTLISLYSGSMCLCESARRCARADMGSRISPSCSDGEVPGGTAHLSNALTPFACAVVTMPLVPRRACHMQRACASHRHVLTCASPARRTDGAGREMRQQISVDACSSKRDVPRPETGLRDRERERLELWQRATPKGGPLISVQTSEVHP